MMRLRGLAGGAASSRLTRAALVAILLWSLALRLFFGLRPTNPTERHDERYNSANVQSIVETGSWTPRTFYYSFLSYAPQAAIAAAFDQVARKGGQDRFAIVEANELTRFATYGFRAAQAFYGTALVFVLFLIARRLGGDGAGLLASALASSSWSYVRIGAWFKPDALAALCTALAILWAIRAEEKPTARRYGLAGVGIGLATSAKFIGVFAALPLVMSAARPGAGWRLRWRHLALASVASALTFFATSPFWRSNLAAARRIAKDYAWRGHGDSYTGVLAQIFGDVWLQVHGTIVGSLFWLGALAAFLPATSRYFEPARRRSLRGLAAFSILFPLAMLLLSGSPFLRANNVFPAMPAVTVLASVTGAEIWRRLASLSGRLAGPAATIAASLVLVLPAAFQGSRMIYCSAVPTTEDLALLMLRGMLAESGRGAGMGVAVLENRPSSLPSSLGNIWRTDSTLAVRRVASLAGVPPSHLAAADAEIFPQDRLSAGVDDFYAARRRAADADGTLIRVASGPRRLRGPALFLIAHPWRALSGEALAPVERAPGALLAYHLPENLVRGEMISLTVRAPAKRPLSSHLRLGGRRVTLHERSRFHVGGATVYLTERLPAEPGALVELLPSDARPPKGRRRSDERAAAAPVSVELLRWRPGTKAPEMGDPLSASEGDGNAGADDAPEGELDDEP